MTGWTEMCVKMRWKAWRAAALSASFFRGSQLTNSTYARQKNWMSWKFLSSWLDWQNYWWYFQNWLLSLSNIERENSIFHFQIWLASVLSKVLWGNFFCWELDVKLHFLSVSTPYSVKSKVLLSLLSISGFFWGETLITVSQCYCHAVGTCTW